MTARRPNTTAKTLATATDKGRSVEGRFVYEEKKEKKMFRKCTRFMEWEPGTDESPFVDRGGR